MIRKEQFLLQYLRPKAEYTALYWDRCLCHHSQLTQTSIDPVSSEPSDAAKLARRYITQEIDMRPVSISDVRFDPWDSCCAEHNISVLWQRYLHLGFAGLDGVRNPRSDFADVSDRLALNATGIDHEIALHPGADAAGSERIY